jgi:hypothetical protein
MSRALRKAAAATLVLFVAALNAWTQFGYLADTQHRDWRAVLEQLRRFAGEHSDEPVWIGLQDPALPSLAALYTEGHPTWSLSGADGAPIGHENGSARMLALDAELKKFYSETAFDLGNGKVHHFKRYNPPIELRDRGGSVVLPAGDNSVVNASHARPASGQIYIAPLADQKNILVQVDTELGRVHYPGATEHIGLWDHEGDFTGWPRGIQAVGRHILFEVLNPVPGSRLLLDYTTASLAGRGISLPPVVAYGAGQYDFGLEGIGATRALSDPITPREIDGRFYIAIDFGMDELSFPVARHGLSALYNAELPDDPRHVVGFARNISLLAPDEVAAIAPPAAVSSFPAGLAASGLFFSGASEDGWMADHAWFELALPGPSNLVHLTGMVPGFSPKILDGTAKVLIDGNAVSEGKLYAGAFDVSIPIPEAVGPREIGFEISGADTLPAPDGRLVTIQLTSLALGWRSAQDSGPAQAK